MSFDLDLSERARHARRLADSVLASTECLERIDVLVRSAAAHLSADLASLSMSTDRQITLSACTATATRVPAAVRGAETAFEDTVCANALRSEKQLAIADARLDARVSSIPAVREGQVGAYLGSPLRHDGSIVGMLCVVSTQTRTWTPQEMAILDRAADDVLSEIVGLATAAETA